MQLMTSALLQSFVENNKMKSEGLLPELVKRLILSSCSKTTGIRMPGNDDVWAPGFDGIVDCQEGNAYVAGGRSVWECGITADSLKKLNSDFSKRNNDSLGIDKATTTFYLVIPRIWAYDNQGMPITKWENDRKDGWKAVHVYDASALCNWLDSEPNVCAWLFEQYGENKHSSFSSVAGAWGTFSNHTDPPLTFSMFLEGRESESEAFRSKCGHKLCRVRAATFMDAYGFCLSSLMQHEALSNQIVVVNNEDTYYEISRCLKGKVFLLSFPFSGQASDFNSTIVCYSKEDTHSNDMIELPALWKSQVTKALCEMGLSDTIANECYTFTHGNLLSLIRRIPGNLTDSRPQWANSPKAYLLYPIVFMRQFCITNELEKKTVAEIAGVDYSELERQYELFLRMEDAPIKRVEDYYYIINYEEAWMTLQIDLSDIMASRMHETIVALLAECGEANEYQTRQQASIIHRLIYNYIYFAETGSDTKTIDIQVKEILKKSKISGCNALILKELPVLSEASPSICLEFIESELDDGIITHVFDEADLWSGDYTSVLWALDKLVLQTDAAIRACRVLYRLCCFQREYRTRNSPKESLLSALCLWDDHAAVTIEEKTHLAMRFIDDNCAFGVPFAIELISKESILRGVRIGEKERRFGEITRENLRLAYGNLASTIINVSIREKRSDWLGKLLEVYWFVPDEVLSSSSALLATTGFSPQEKMPLIYQLRRHLYYMEEYGQDGRIQWVEALNKWLDSLTTDDPISKEGWRFYEFYNPPFLELLTDDLVNDYLQQEKKAEEIRQEVFTSVRNRFGIDAIVDLVNCMEDDWSWGEFLGRNLVEGEHSDVAVTTRLSKRIRLLSGMISTVDLQIALGILNGLSKEELESLLPLLCRNDIDEIIVSPEQQRLYWQNKRMNVYNDRDYHKLLKYNPCGILPIFIHKERDPKAFERLAEVVRAIVDCDTITDSGLLTHVIQTFDAYHYSDEWARNCLSLFEKDALKGIYGYYPTCLRTYFFRYPEKIVAKLRNDSDTLYRYFFSNNYSLPEEAFHDYPAFLTWIDYLYGTIKEEPCAVSVLGAILGKSPSGKDGIFPHEFVRLALEQYSDEVLTSRVAISWLNSRGCRFVTDGLSEKKKELQYREYARRLELEYPQSSKLLLLIADDYALESKRDQLEAEVFPR